MLYRSEVDNCSSRQWGISEQRAKTISSQLSAPNQALSLQPQGLTKLKDVASSNEITKPKMATSTARINPLGNQHRP